MRWLFALLILANLATPLFAGNRYLFGQESGPDRGFANSEAETIMLLAEAEGGGDSPAGERSAAVADCIVLGPIESASTLARLEQAGNQLGLSMQRRTRQIESGVDYWVHLEQQPSVRATTRLIRELRAGGIESFVVSEGALEGVIAVGIFSDRSGAEARSAHLIGMGYQAAIHEMQRWTREHWLLVDGSSPAASRQHLDKLALAASVSQKNHSVNCKTVASTGGFQ